jgi:hypothetical protein
VNCARSVIDLITLYWPHSIDILQPERATVEGFRPIFFSGQGEVILSSVCLYLYQPTEIYANRMILRNPSSVMAKGRQLSSEQINVSP